VTGREAAFLDHRGPVVEEVAQRPSRDVVGWVWDGSGTVLRGFEARPRTASHLSHRWVCGHHGG